MEVDPKGFRLRAKQNNIRHSKSKSSYPQLHRRGRYAGPPGTKRDVIGVSDVDAVSGLPCVMTASHSWPFQFPDRAAEEGILLVLSSRGWTRDFVSDRQDGP
jgi:hypothetical protein